MQTVKNVLRQCYARKEAVTDEVRADPAPAWGLIQPVVAHCLFGRA
jgi:hypothetical protein